MPAKQNYLIFFAVFVLCVQVAVTIQPKYDTKIWEGEGGSVKVQEAHKEYARTEKERASAAEVGKAKARVAGIEQYPVPVVNYPVVAKVPVPIPVYHRRVIPVYPKAVYGHGLDHFGHGVGHGLGHSYGLGGYGGYGGYGGFGHGPFYSKNVLPYYGAYGHGHGFH